jgi:hypothetical protein
MRELTSLSYSSLSKWETDPETFYMERLADKRIDREPQGEPASVGSAFDAYVKSALAADLGLTTPSLEFEPLFESQVEPHNRDKARVDGAYALACYKRSGEYADLLAELGAAFDPQLELEASGTVEGIPLMGKPDLMYRHADGSTVIFDWKVKSFYSKHACSPTKGYRLCRDGWALNHALPSRSNGTTHKLFKAIYGCMTLHDGCLSEFSEDYADQLTIYSWISGTPVGKPFIAAIDELACAPHKKGGSPLIRVSELRAPVTTAHQRKLLDRLLRCWNAITSEHVFTDLSLEDSKRKQAMLENAASQMTGEEGAYFAKQGRKGWF